MSSIEERIEKHKQNAMNAEKKFTRAAQTKAKWEDKYHFHIHAIKNLEEKKAKQEKKVD